jgi:hypothetical protein
MRARQQCDAKAERTSTLRRRSARAKTSFS